MAPEFYDNCIVTLENCVHLVLVEVFYAFLHKYRNTFKANTEVQEFMHFFNSCNAKTITKFRFELLQSMTRNPTIYNLLTDDEDSDSLEDEDSDSDEDSDDSEDHPSLFYGL